MLGIGILYVAGRPVLITDGDTGNGGLNDFSAEGYKGNEVDGKGATTNDLALVVTRVEGDNERYKPFTATFDISLTLFCMSTLIKGLKMLELQMIVQMIMETMTMTL